MTTGKMSHRLFVRTNYLQELRVKEVYQMCGGIINHFGRLICSNACQTCSFAVHISLDTVQKQRNIQIHSSYENLWEKQKTRVHPNNPQTTLTLDNEMIFLC